MEKQLELNEERIRLYERFKHLLPEVGSALLGVQDAAYKDGAAPSMQKRNAS